MSEDSIIKKTAKKLKQHRKKAGALSIATLITGLQMVGALGPVLCSLPFITDTKACLDRTQKAGQAADQLATLKLDDGTTMTFETIDGGQ